MVDEILPASSDCLHVGWALWVDWWQFWCGNCGVTVSESNYISDFAAHQPGELWRGNDTHEGYR